jgi:hypothetical protein
VALYFTVDTAEGEPLPGLTADRFNIYEDGRLISVHESQQTILNPEVAAVRYTLLLLDMSASVTETGQVPLIEDAVWAFVDNIGEQEQIAIYAFDGRAEIQPIVEFSQNEGQNEARLASRAGRVAAFRPEDPSTNLYGAIIEASRVLQEVQQTAEVPLRFATLVVFTDGTDRAHRATSSDAMRAVRDADASIWVIGLGGEVDEEELQLLGRDGYVHVGGQEAVVEAFEGVAARIQGLASRFYLLSYCSPARAGTHRLEVEAVVGEDRGRTSYEFDAEGFEPGCDPETPPAFDVPGTRPRPRSGPRPATPRPATEAQPSGGAGGTMSFEGSDAQREPADDSQWE